MSLISDRQKKIFEFIKSNEPEATKLNEIVLKFDFWYYCNGRKHVSDIVFRMFKSGKLLKPKNGYYSVNYKYNGSRINKDEVSENQLNIFDLGA